MNSQQRYISNELTHFVGKGTTCEEQYQLLLKILKEGKLIHWRNELIKIRGVPGTTMEFNPKAKVSENEMFNPGMICFCDIPIGDLNIHIRKYSPFGLSFAKHFIVQHGGSPVYYISGKTPIIHSMFANVCNNKGELFDKIVPELYKHFANIGIPSRSETESSEVQQKVSFLSFLALHIFGYLKCFDHELQEDQEDNYYFEREWRIIGDLTFTISDIKRIFISQDYASRFSKDVPQYHGQLTFADLPKEREA